MADNFAYTPGSGEVGGADDIGGVKYPRVKLIYGADGVNSGDVATANPLPTVDAAAAAAIAALQTAVETGDSQLPPALGPQTAANSLSVVNAISTAPTNASGTITTGGTAQNAAAANSSRRGFLLQNHSSGDLWFSTIATAVQSQPSIKLPPGAYYESPPFGGGVGAISIIGATTGQAFTGREW